MARKKVLDTNDRIGLRLSTHEKICAERMKTLCKSVEELKVEVRSLRNDVSKGKGMLHVLVFLGAVAASIIGYFNLDG